MWWRDPLGLVHWIKKRGPVNAAGSTSFPSTPVVRVVAGGEVEAAALLYAIANEYAVLAGWFPWGSGGGNSSGSRAQRPAGTQAGAAHEPDRIV